ncbi:MAG: hypothetical protein WAO74_11615 [Polaribacter sp.]
MALFQIWNSARFADEFYVIRNEVMKYSKIGSKSTYHRCVKELNHWNYIMYFPSHNPYHGSKIKMLKFETRYGQAQVHNRSKNETSSGQALVPIYKHIQTIVNKNIYKQENFKKSNFNDSENHSNHNSSVPNQDNLKTTKNKNYNEPL